MITQQLYPGMIVAISEGTMDEPLQDVIDTASATQSAVKLSGVFKRTTPLVVKTNTNLSGDMYGFTSAIRAYDCPAILMDGNGVAGGFCFNNIIRNLSIWLDNITIPVLYGIYSNNAYRCKLENIRFIGGEISDSKMNSLLHIDGIQNHNDYTKIIAMGSVEGSSSGCGIKISNTGGSVVLNQPDVEAAFKGILIAPNSKIDIYSPYTERCSVAIDINAGSGPSQTPSVNVFGGNIQLASATSVGVRFNGNFSHGEIVNIMGTTFSTDDKDTKNHAFKFNTFGWVGQPRIYLSGIDWSWIDKPLQLQGSAVISPINPF